MRVLALAAALLAAAPASAATKPAKLAITPQSSDGAVMMLGPRLANVEYVLGISAFDPIESALKTNSFSGGWVNLNVRPRSPKQPDAETYVVQRVKPGRYVVRDVSQQASWAVCFGEKTVQFDVAPGEIVFLGRLDATTPIAELQSNVALRDNFRAGRGTVYHYMEDISPPTFAPVDTAALAAAQAFVRSDMPKTSVAPRAAVLRPARFGTGKTLFGQAICGGYFQKKVAPADAAEPQPQR